MSTNKENLLPCPCCGQSTLSEEGTYEICPACFWEDDPVQSNDPTYLGGANHISLLQARESWVKQNLFNKKDQDLGRLQNSLNQPID